MMSGKAKKVWREEAKQRAHPSVYSRAIYRVLREELLRNSWDHPLQLLGSYLNPIFLEMEFLEESLKRKERREKAEEFARKLVRMRRLGTFPGDQSEPIRASSLYLLDSTTTMKQKSHLITMWEVRRGHLTYLTELTQSTQERSVMMNFLSTTRR